MKSSFWKYQLKNWLPFYLYLVILWYVSSQPVGLVENFVQKTFYLEVALQHVLAYAFLAILLHRALSFSRPASKLLVIIVTTLYGALMEINQHFIPGRFFGYDDIFMDFLGAIFGLILISIYRWKTNRV